MSLTLQTNPTDGVLSNEVPGEVVVAGIPGGKQLTIIDYENFEEDLKKTEIIKEIQRNSGGDLSKTLHKYLSSFSGPVFKKGEKITGVDPVIADDANGNNYRIPSVCITKEGRIHLVCDVRRTGKDEHQIEVVHAWNDGKGWNKHVIGKRYTGDGYAPQNSRVMDPTILDAGEGKLFVLAGRWTTGDTTWTKGNSANSWSAALLIKSTDNGLNWTQNTIGKSRCSSKEGTHITVQNLRSGCKGFLGGINAGFKHSSGKLIFAIQFTTGSGDAKSTLLISEDGGNSWRMAGGDTGGTNYEPSMIELEDGSIVLHCRSEDSDASGGRSAYKKAFITRDFGETFQVYEPLNLKLGSVHGGVYGYRCEAGTFAAKTLSGVFICGANYPQVENNPNLGPDSWQRNQITFYSCNLKTSQVKPLDMIQYEGGTRPQGGTVDYGGYSSLYYKQTLDGELLLCAYEDLLGISIKNISNLIPRLENIQRVEMLTPQEVQEVKNIPNVVDTKIQVFPSNFISYVNTSKLAKQYNLIGVDGTIQGQFDVKGAYLSGGELDPTKISLSNVARGLIRLNLGTANGTIRGPVKIGGEDLITIAFSFFLPSTQVGRGNYVPLIRFFNNPTETSQKHTVSGFEVDKQNQIYLTSIGDGNEVPKNPATPPVVARIQTDKLYNFVAEIRDTSVKVFLNGELKSTSTVNAGFLTSFKSASYMSIGNHGANDKGLDTHIGCIAIYGRELTDAEKNSVVAINGLPLKEELVSSNNDQLELIQKLNRRIEELESTAKMQLEYPLTFKKLSTLGYENAKYLLNIPRYERLAFNMDQKTIRAGQMFTNPNNIYYKGETTPEVPFKVNNIKTTTLETLTGSPDSFDNDAKYTTDTGYYLVGKNKKDTCFDVSGLNLMGGSNPTNEMTLQFTFNCQWLENPDCQWATMLSIVFDDSVTDWVQTDAYSTTVGSSDGYRKKKALRFEFNNSDTGRLNLTASGAQAYTAINGQQVISSIPSVNTANSSWVTVTVVIKDKNVKTYCDGNPATNNTVNETIEHFKLLCFTNTFRKPGNISYKNIRIWDVALTDDEVKKSCENIDS